ncbi:MAG: FAD:protein FMN transferase, partial [Firmicutes bacterium]|nr:FAD:protein FMN transferase [Bacillota bacterium]
MRKRFLTMLSLVLVVILSTFAFTACGIREDNWRDGAWRGYPRNSDMIIVSPRSLGGYRGGLGHFGNPNTAEGTIPLGISFYLSRSELPAQYRNREQLGNLDVCPLNSAALQIPWVDEMIREMRQVITDINNIMSAGFNDSWSMVNQINRAGTNPVTITGTNYYLFDILDLARGVYLTSGGLFNPAILPLVDIWLLSPRFIPIEGTFAWTNQLRHGIPGIPLGYSDPVRTNNQGNRISNEFPLLENQGQGATPTRKRPPAASWINTILRDDLMPIGNGNYANRISFAEVFTWDRNARTVTKLHPRAQLDLGGVAKGYAGYLIHNIARTVVRGDGGVGINAVIDLSGDIYTLGTDILEGRNWVTGIANQHFPQLAAEYIIEVVSASNAVFTSGVSERNFIYEGRMYHHKIDPRTGMPSTNGIVSTTIIGPNAAYADALATAVFLKGDVEGPRWLRQHYPQYRAIIVTSDMRLIVSHNDISFRFGNNAVRQAFTLVDAALHPFAIAAIVAGSVIVVTGATIFVVLHIRKRRAAAQYAYDEGDDIDEEE